MFGKTLNCLFLVLLKLLNFIFCFLGFLDFDLLVFEFKFPVKNLDAFFLKKLLDLILFFFMYSLDFNSGLFFIGTGVLFACFGLWQKVSNKKLDLSFICRKFVNFFRLMIGVLKFVKTGLFGFLNDLAWIDV